jgi:hypothetical protein
MIDLNFDARAWTSARLSVLVSGFAARVVAAIKSAKEL